jgi:hypothetical protein
MQQRLGRTVLLTNRQNWTAEEVVTGYDGQQQLEQVFRGLKFGCVSLTKNNTYSSACSIRSKLPLAARILQRCWLELKSCTAESAKPSQTVHA